MEFGDMFRISGSGCAFPLVSHKSHRVVALLLQSEMVAITNQLQCLGFRV